MDGCDAGALTVNLGPRIGLVELDVCGIGGPTQNDPALAALLQAAQDVVLDRHTPGVVVLPGLEHGAGGRGRVATPLELQRVEEGAVGHVVPRIDLGAQEVTWL